MSKTVSERTEYGVREYYNRGKTFDSWYDETHTVEQVRAIAEQLQRTCSNNTFKVVTRTVSTVTSTSTSTTVSEPKLVQPERAVLPTTPGLYIADFADTSPEGLCNRAAFALDRHGNWRITVSPSRLTWTQPEIVDFLGRYGCLRLVAERA